MDIHQAEQRFGPDASIAPRCGVSGYIAGRKVDIALAFKKMKKTIKTILIIALAPVGYLIGGMYPWTDHIFKKNIEIIKNIELPKDSAFGAQDNNSSAFMGEIREGSRCWQVMRKGNVVYITCSATVKGDAIKYPSKS